VADRGLLQLVFERQLRMLKREAWSLDTDRGEQNKLRNAGLTKSSQEL
jgi:hypothetical protein